MQRLEAWREASSRLVALKSDGSAPSGREKVLTSLVHDLIEAFPAQDLPDHVSHLKCMIPTSLYDCGAGNAPVLARSDTHLSLDPTLSPSPGPALLLNPTTYCMYIIIPANTHTHTHNEKIHTLSCIYIHPVQQTPAQDVVDQLFEFFSSWLSSADPATELLYTLALLKPSHHVPKVGHTLSLCACFLVESMVAGCV